MALAEPKAHRFTVDEYYRMADAGIFNEDSRVELLRGEIVGMAAIGSHHAACVAGLTQLFGRRLGDRAFVWAQNPVRLDDLSEPEPDIALLRPRGDNYAGGHPTPNDVLLLVEVGDTSATWDRDHKLPLYADAGVAEVWLVDLPSGSVEVCRLPGNGAYQERVTCNPGELVTPDAFHDVAIDVADILPPGSTDPAT
ncbi:MAG: Uma2 family endonuclease [Acidimicrobiales bacterium]